ncbi:TetR/AcrR family transcriptional regulator [Arthrobacter jiangjiafuii]|uniref:TetR/AcrR family transcriptional regulator n=2 Tax=Arthrobacter jiangjiafuii TaxID=2817475 RepID=A0A975M8W7_9MICC|nr:TetR/AcrR family transcriptional regulator [Arthrobacter jiangjiafuii]QWC11874.1 TetR/AcrR family transcriptional regulator [Arthrobacter jiangjiafuii]
MDGSTPNAPSEGLRARKRAAARSAIEKTAVRLALEHGYEHVTVEMICTECMVSQRTFFNYFGSKESVFLGPAPAAAAEVVAGGFLADTGTPVVLSLATAVFSTLLEGQPDPVLARDRMKVVMGSPELLAKQNEWMAAHEKQMAELVLQRYAAVSGPDADPAGIRGRAAEAQLVVGLALGVVRVALQQNQALQQDQALQQKDDGGWPVPGIMERSGELLGKIFGS